MPTSSQNSQQQPLTPEREQEIRDHLATTPNASLGNLAARDLLAELDRLRKERDQLRADNADERREMADMTTVAANLVARPTRAQVLRRAADSVEQTFMVGVTPATERNKVWDEAVRAVSTDLRRMAVAAERGEQS